MKILTNLVPGARFIVDLAVKFALGSFFFSVETFFALFRFSPSSPISRTSTSIHPTSQPVSHLTSQPTLITSPPPKGSYFLIARPSCSGIPEINFPPLCYSYYLGVLELAWPSKQTLYSAFFLTPLLPPLSTSSDDLISGHTLQPGMGRAHRLQR